MIQKSVRLLISLNPFLWNVKNAGDTADAFSRSGYWKVCEVFSSRLMCDATVKTELGLQLGSERPVWQQAYVVCLLS